MSDCVEWDGKRMSNGYGYLYVSRRGNVPAHRYAYEQAHGAIPPGLVVMHSCDNRICVNVDHLSVGTQKDNMQDMARKGRHVGNGWKHLDACRRGHEFTPENTWVDRRDGTRSCKECRRQANRRYEQNHPERASQTRRRPKEKSRA